MSNPGGHFEKSKSIQAQLTITVHYTSFISTQKPPFMKNIFPSLYVGKQIMITLYDFGRQHIFINLFTCRNLVQASRRQTTKIFNRYNFVPYPFCIQTSYNNNLFRIPTSPKCFSVGSCRNYVQYNAIQYNTIQHNAIRYAIRLVSFNAVFYS